VAAYLRILCAVAIAIAQLPAFGSESGQATEELFVTTNRSSRTALDLIGNTAKITSEPIRITNAQHIYELGVRATGTWLSRGSGQENLTAIRSPVLTGPGACGAFLFLEDSIPIRPTGFCNVNELFEIPSELANTVEILRGPSNALYGSNGLHGTINVLMPEPGGKFAWNGSLETGPDDFWRAKGGLSDEKIAVGVLADDYSGWRDSSGYDQQKVFFRLDQDAADSTWRFGFDYTSLNQDTAGFIRGKNAYKDADLRKTNPDPDAFRNADSQRFYARWMPDADHAWNFCSIFCPENRWRKTVRSAAASWRASSRPGERTVFIRSVWIWKSPTDTSRNFNKQTSAARPVRRDFTTITMFSR
jgi:outer membrane cobalamin receptor